ncbi:MAG: SGNH/GDSL hydrolase family protein [Spirochaetales bacterium]|nr:SGNH/GDSL hydrolase family protein [Spirochaetales bacterium]
MDFNGKTVSFLGDSITEGACVSDIEKNRYDNVVLRELGLKKVNNYGISGTRIAHQFTPSEKARHDLDFCGRCFDMDPSSDVIVVFGGTNDYGHGDAPLGTVGDKCRITFCGCMNYLIDTIRELYPKAKLVVMTPAHRVDDFLAPEKKKDLYGIIGLSLKDYVDDIVEICKMKNVPVLNLFENLGIDPNKKEDYEKYTGDGLHFNDSGHVAIGKLLSEFLRSL